MDAWRTLEYPKIARWAKRENALVFFVDASGMRSDHHAGTSWGFGGQTPIVKATGARFGCYTLSAVNALGHFRFMVAEGRVNGTVFRQFLRRLTTGIERKIFLIVDGHPSHQAKLAQKFVAEHADRIEPVFLPPHSAELNPDAFGWAHIF